MTSKTQSSLDWIFGRRSIRVYSPGAVSEAELTQLLKAAMAGPSAMTKDPWRFLVVQDPAMLAHLAAVLPGGKMLTTSAAAIVVCGDQEAALEQQLSYLLQDCSAAIENLLLAAHVLGIGACWVGIHPGEKPLRRVKALLGLPAAVLPVAAISLGRPGEQPEARTRYREDFVKREKWS